MTHHTSPNSGSGNTSNVLADTECCGQFYWPNCPSSESSASKNSRRISPNQPSTLVVHSCSTRRLSIESGKVVLVRRHVGNALGYPLTIGWCGYASLRFQQSWTRRGTRSFHTPFIAFPLPPIPPEPLIADVWRRDCTTPVRLIGTTLAPSIWRLGPSDDTHKVGLRNSALGRPFVQYGRHGS
jgi:hypothetical protein